MSTGSVPAGGGGGGDGGGGDGDGGSGNDENESAAALTSAPATPHRASGAAAGWLRAQADAAAAVGGLAETSFTPSTPARPERVEKVAYPAPSPTPAHLPIHHPLCHLFFHFTRANLTSVTLERAEAPSPLCHDCPTLPPFVP